jgi:hypothetical protein
VNGRHHPQVGQLEAAPQQTGAIPNLWRLGRYQILLVLAIAPIPDHAATAYHSWYAGEQDGHLTRISRAAKFAGGG